VDIAFDVIASRNHERAHIHPMVLQVTCYGEAIPAVIAAPANDHDLLFRLHLKMLP